MHFSFYEVFVNIEVSRKREYLLVGTLKDEEMVNDRQREGEGEGEGGRGEREREREG
jgi:hypothetical protein